MTLWRMKSLKMSPVDIVINRRKPDIYDVDELKMTEKAEIRDPGNPHECLQRRDLNYQQIAHLHPATGANQTCGSQITSLSMTISPENADRSYILLLNLQ
jgi:hypothetical protein